MPPPVFRFAPSPNGYLHLGHAYSALLNFDPARQAGGRFLLRIEDIDATRCKPEFEAAIYRGSRLARHRLGTAGAAAIGAFCRLSRGDRHGCRRRAWSIRASRAAPKSRGWWREREAARRLAARSRRRAALSRDAQDRSSPDERDAVARSRARLTRCGSTWRRRVARTGDLAWTRARPGPGGETGAVTARPGSLGRRHPGAQGDADQLSSLGGDRRRPAGRHRRGAGRGPVLVDQRASAAAGAARPAAAGLPASPADSG